MKQDSNNYWEQLERLEKLIRAAEIKAGIIFSFHSLILGLFVDRMDYLQSIFHEDKTFVVVGIFWISFVLLSIFYCFKCFRPRIELKYTKNVFFFRDAVYSFGNIKEYTKKLIEVCGDDKELYRRLGEQIHVESKIIDQKFTSIRKSIRYFAISFGFVIVLIALWILKL